MKGRPGKQPAVGLLLVSAEEATIAEWQPRGVEILRKQELRRNEAEEHEADDRSLSRPRRSGATKTAPHASGRRDLWERRLEDHRARFARTAAGSAAQTAQRRGWEIVLSRRHARSSRVRTGSRDHARRQTARFIRHVPGYRTRHADDLQPVGLHDTRVRRGRLPRAPARGRPRFRARAAVRSAGRRFAPSSRGAAGPRPCRPVRRSPGPPVSDVQADPHADLTAETHEKARAMHEHARELHRSAAEIQEEHARHSRNRGEEEWAVRAEGLAQKERELEAQEARREQTEARKRDDAGS